METTAMPRELLILLSLDLSTSFNQNLKVVNTNQWTKNNNNTRNYNIIVKTVVVNLTNSLNIWNISQLTSNCFDKVRHSANYFKKLMKFKPVTNFAPRLSLISRPPIILRQIFKNFLENLSIHSEL